MRKREVIYKLAQCLYWLLPRSQRTVQLRVALAVFLEEYQGGV